MGTHPIFESDFDCLTACFIECSLVLHFVSPPAALSLLQSRPMVSRAHTPQLFTRLPFNLAIRMLSPLTWLCCRLCSRISPLPTTLPIRSLPPRTSYPLLAMWRD